MPQATLTCQLDNPATGDSSRISLPGQRTNARNTAPDATTWTPVRGDDQEIAATASRRTGPRRWLRAVTWLISAGLHPKANTTTMRIAEDLAARMDYDLGHVLYGLDRLAARLGIGRATTKRHVRYLRELGALAFVTHGTQRNSRRARGLEGYAPTATTYAATIPPCFDHAMGHRLIGTGYEARIVIDQRGQTPVDNPGAEQGREPLSLTGVKEVGQVQMVGGVTTTGKPVANRSTTTPQQASNKPRRKRTTILGATVTAAGMQLGDKLARTLRRTFPWLRAASHDELRWVCADMGEQQWTEQQTIQFVDDTSALSGGSGLCWQPDRPHRVLAAGLHKHAELERHDRQLAQASSGTGAITSEEWQEWLGTRAPIDGQAPEPERTEFDRRIAEEAGWNAIGIVMDHIDEHGEDDAIDLYGIELTARAAKLAACPSYQTGVFG
ncbi:hypothetical protein ACFW81_24080 [Streptomyces angustmyceticus]|uniref:hypothetical protein n=1 Tax=Streptomyces angustmyceticus TaxID=285578 RepID=UPI0036B8C3E2